MVTIINVFLVFFISTGTLAFGQLQATASARVLQAHRPSSRSKYQGQFRSFIMFCIFYQLSIVGIYSPHIMAFIEFLTQNGLSTRPLWPTFLLSSTSSTTVALIRCPCHIKTWLSCWHPVSKPFHRILLSKGFSLCQFSTLSYMLLRYSIGLLRI